MLDFHYKTLGENDEVLLFVLSGNLDTTQCEYLYNVIGKEIRKGQEKLILDCHDLGYISSMGLAMMLRVHAKMRKIGGDVKLAGVNGTVADVIRLVKLDRILQLYDTVDEAIESIEEQEA
ncbi:MAG: STAS domain-containing protein [Rubripirellula sp.]